MIQFIGCAGSILLVALTGLPVFSIINGRLLVVTHELANIMMASGLTIILFTIPSILRQSSSKQQHSIDNQLVAIILIAVWSYSNFKLYRWTSQWSPMGQATTYDNYVTPEWTLVYQWNTQLLHAVHFTSAFTSLTLLLSAMEFATQPKPAK